MILKRRSKQPVYLKDDERTRLLYGPYEPPLVKGGFLVDALRGKVPFACFSNALIPWPKIKRRGKSGSGGFALCGDLIRALKDEAALAICHYWGVSRATVGNWRRALGLKERSLGAQRLVRLGVELARLPESRKKFSEAARGRVLSAAHKSRLFAGIHRGWQRRFHARRAEYRRTGRFPKATKSDPWIPEEEKLLPKLPTSELVRVLGRTSKSIQARRIFLDIRARPPAFQQPWKPWEIQLLGTDSDRAVAERLGRSIHSVENKRRTLGIQTANPRLWRPEEDAILGQISDAKAARLLGRSCGAVQHRRCRLGGAFFHFKQGPKWTVAEDALLGTDTDPAIARKLNRTAPAVRRRRCKKGIPAKNSPRPWTKQEMALLGSASDVAVAGKLKRTVNSVRTKRLKSHIPPGTNLRWTPAEDKFLGKLPDKQVAKKLRRSVLAVRLRRNKIHIPILHAKCRLWEKWELDLLGTAPDQEVAKHTGRAVSAVQDKRHQMHIPSANPKWRYWTPELDKLLGTLPDEQLASILHHPRKAVAARRQRLGIPSMAGDVRAARRKRGRDPASP